MTTRPVAAMLLGFVLAATTLGGSALLLFTTRGLLATVGFLAAITLVSLAGGLWVGGAEPSGDAPTAVRNRWAGLALVFLIAVGWNLLWQDRPLLRQAPYGGAITVLLLLAAPAYLAGGVLAGLNRQGVRSVASMALAGAGLGALAAAVFLIPRYDPHLLFLGAAGATLLAGFLDRGPALNGGDTMQGKVIIITGLGNRGQVAYSIAQKFVHAGARLVVSDVTESVMEIATELGSDVHGVVADLTTEAGAQRVVEEARSRFGRLDALINVAGGLSVIETVADTSLELWRREHQRNGDTVLLMCQAALPMLRESGGAVVNFASPAATQAPARMAAYSAAKAAVAALTRALAIEERESGVRVNAIAPGMIDTEQNRRGIADPEARSWVTREQVAELAYFLASPAAAGVNGEVVKALGATLK
jgi:NAD(P)-dependent dehydrogenase (short-subunit alcohol dehydrogenase family)